MYPKVNQKIIIEIPGENVTCYSIVADVTQDEIRISHPLTGDTIGRFPAGTEIDVSFLSGENKYQFKANILGRLEDKILLYRITKPLEQDISKIQLRENFRVETNLRIKIEDMELHTVNISAGGMLFSCNVDLTLSVGNEVSGTMYIPDVDPISFKGVIKRILQPDDEVKHAAMKFTVLDRKDESKIVQFCFQKQRQMRMVRQSPNNVR
ncbi:flagellar brake protein [Neobacillus mesonae]|uniref:flagellar brake protein n=1 Tax=Neobacillus mesonae TaxID=1193713 RepID=UPI00203DBDE8|nr:flagellar brake protein [Neobacillus mesonae]MCM3567023.1 flagellar brake protein [Neobacillus mesonae]